MRSFENGIEHNGSNDNNNNNDDNKHEQAGLAYMDEHPGPLFSTCSTHMRRIDKGGHGECVSLWI
jgi:hypothetical protein